MKSTEAASICKALGDPNRLQIIRRLTDGEKCACSLLEYFNITQPTLSHHMKVLCACNLVHSRKDGKWNHYSLNCETLCSFKNYIGTLCCTKKKEEPCK